MERNRENHKMSTKTEALPTLSSCSTSGTLFFESAELKQAWCTRVGAVSFACSQDKNQEFLLLQGSVFSAVIMVPTVAKPQEKPVPGKAEITYPAYGDIRRKMPTPKQ